MDVLDRVPGLAEAHAALRQEMQDARLRARAYTRRHGEDIPEVTEWSWGRNPETAAGYAETGGDNT